MNEIINGYELSAPFQNQNAGFSRWTFAVKESKEFFLKEFLDPVYPNDDVLSEHLKKRKVADCTLYEEKKKRLYEAIDRAECGNLIRIQEFFRNKSHYYIATEKIAGKSLSVEEIAGRAQKNCLLLCLGLAYSLKKLHEENVVHADIKETNVLVRESVTGQMVAKVIDFDCAFFEYEPPSEDELGGDQVYLSPEACMFLCEEPVELTCKMDVFALGILFHQYLTGELPGFDGEEYDYVHEAVLDGQQIKISEQLPPQLREIISQMLECEPVNRISMEEVFEKLAVIIFGEDESLKKKRLEEESRKAKEAFFAPAGDL